MRSWTTRSFSTAGTTTLPTKAAPQRLSDLNKFFNNYPDELSENLKYLDVLGGVEIYNHYPARLGTQQGIISEEAMMPGRSKTKLNQGKAKPSGSRRKVLR